MKKREEYTRATRGQMRQSAKNGPKQGGGPPLFNLPDGMELFEIKKSGILRLDFVPYVVREESHPERIKKKTLWPKRMFRTHNTPMGKIICAKSVDPTRKCRWCKKFFELKKECDENEDLSDKQKDKILNPFQGQTWEGFFIVNPKNPKKVMFYPTSWGKFPKKLSEVCETTSQKNLLYFEPTSDGRTLKCSFNKKTFNGSQFFECTNIEFKPREELDEGMIIKQTKDIASLLNVLPDETLKKMFYQNDEGDKDDRPGKSFKKKSKSRKDEDDDSDEEDSDETPKRKKKDTMAKDKSKKKSKKSDDDEDEDEKPSKKSSKKKGKVKKKAKEEDDDEEEEDEEEDEEEEDDDEEEEDEEEDEEEEDDDEEEEEEKPKKKKGKKSKPAKKSKKKDDDEDEEEEEKPKKKKGKKSKPAKKSKKKDDDEDEEDEDEEE